MSTRERWSKILLLVGYIAMLVGALDPLEGSVVILPGSAFVALGTVLSPSGRQWLAHRSWGFVSIAVGLGAMFGLSAIGGIGGKSGHSVWWSVLLLPYLFGWLMGIWGPGSPRWVQLAGIMVGVWYLTMAAIILAGPNVSRRIFPLILLAAGVLGLVIIRGGLWWSRRRAAHPR
jgi:hypothetical protein